MLAEDIDFQRIFRLHPTAMALLTPDLEFVDANDEFVAQTGRELEDLIGRNVFTVLPKMPSDPDGQSRWTILEEAQASGRRESMSLARYDIEDPSSPGVFKERYWSISVTPVRGAGGRVEVLELSAREVTPVIAEFRKLEERLDERPAASRWAEAGNNPVPGLAVPHQSRGAESPTRTRSSGR